MDAPGNFDRFRRLVYRIAGWTDAEVAVVSPTQVRHVAQVVRDGEDPSYPPFAGIENGARGPENAADFPERALAARNLNDVVPLSISSTWDAFERRSIIRAMLVHGDLRAAIALTEADFVRDSTKTGERG